MAKYVYPAVFEPAESGGYVVTFPDWGGATQGENQAEAIEMATDYVNMKCWRAEHCRYKLPKATEYSAISVPDGGFVNLVSADTEEYAKIVEKENNPILYARQKEELNIKGLADLLDAPYRTVQEWNAGRQLPPRWAQKLILEKTDSVC